MKNAKFVVDLSSNILYKYNKNGNPETGTQSPTGEFIHGNNAPESLGKYSSHGYIRMDNEIIQELAKEVKAGDIIILQ